MTRPLAPISGSLDCSRCRTPLAASESSSGYACAACGGEFVPRGAFEGLVQSARAAATRRPYVRPVLSLSEPVYYMACPVCQQQMQRRNYAGTSGVVIDLCSQHGVWFDRGELLRVLEFCSSGGLDAAERSSRERAEMQRRMDAFQRSGGGHYVPERRSDALDLIVDCCFEALDFFS